MYKDSRWYHHDNPISNPKWLPPYLNIYTKVNLDLDLDLGKQK